MEVYKFYGQMSEDGRLMLPDDLKGKLEPKSRIRIMLFLEDEETLWKKGSALKFFQGYAEEDRIYDDL